MLALNLFSLTFKIDYIKKEMAVNHLFAILKNRMFNSLLFAWLALLS